ncbi:MAG: PAC2 family protein [Actinomycetota bacterium]|nr:PAC2 family protein [Acidimicrobiia bacterium]MDQ3293206.1 PAC2 family protein [Actinomycetota bacterium]
MPELYEVVERPDLEAPVLVCILDGWVDAGLGAQNARTALLDGLETVTVATFDADVLLDQRARRPVMHLEQGLLTGLSWPGIELRAASDEDGNDILLLVGAEPDHLWRAFTREAMDLALDLGARLTVTLGAYPAPVPHTRLTQLACSASDEDLARHCQVRSTIDVPAGIHAALERRSHDVGVPAIGLWAQVPHYASAMPSPASSAALVDGLAEIGGLSLPVGDLRQAAETTRQRIDELVSSNPEHLEMVRRLEELYDDSLGGGAGLGSGPLPSGDELAAELERFLREQGGP